MASPVTNRNKRNGLSTGKFYVIRGPVVLIRF